MGVSFKISKTGSRFKPKPVVSETTATNDIAENSGESSRIIAKNESNASATTDSCAPKLDGRDEDAAKFSCPSLSPGRHLFSSEVEVSFILSLYPDGYSITKASENDNGHHVALQDGAKLLHPYDRTSESLFSAIESGLLPGDFLDDIPCKYVDGGLLCEVRDYRKCTSESGSNIVTTDGTATAAKMHLKLSLENVVKDIPSIADESWTYGDLMELESRILKVLQPKLCLDPTPRLGRLSDGQDSSRLNLGLSGMRKRRLRRMPETAVTSTGKLPGKKFCIDRVPESSGYRIGEPVSMPGDLISEHVHENSPAQNIGSSNILATGPRSFAQDAPVPLTNLASPQSKLLLGTGNQRIMQDPNTGTGTNTSGAYPTGQEMMIPYTDNMNSTALVHGKMENQDVQLSPFSALRRARLGPVASDNVQQQQLGSYIDSLQGTDVQWRNTLLQQHPNSRGIQYGSTSIQKHSQLVREGISNQDIATSFPMGQRTTRSGTNGEHIEAEKLDKSDINRGRSDMQILEAESNHMDPRLQQRIPQHPLMRSGIHQVGWNNLGQQVEKDPRKEDQFQKRKSVPSPRLSAGTLAQSPLSAKSTDLSSVSLGTHYGAVSSAAQPGLSQREKSGVTSIAAVPRTLSMTSSANDSIQQHQAQVAAKRRSNSLPKTPAMSGVGSPSSVGNVSVPMNAASPSVGTPPLSDLGMLEKFSKIEAVTQTHKLSRQKAKVDNFLRKSPTFSAQELVSCLSNTSSSENFEDESCAKSLSKSLLGGGINSCKIRVLNIVLGDHTPQGNAVPVASRIRTRLIMSEKPNDGTVAMHYGDIEDTDYLKAEDYLPTLPNTHLADLLAAQFSKLMIRDGYYVEDHVQPRPPRFGIPMGSQPNASVILHNNSAVEMQQYAEAISGPQTGETLKPTVSGNPPLNSSTNIVASTGMLPPANPQALQMPQGLLPGGPMPARSQQLDPQQSLQQQQLPPQNQQSLLQQQQSQFQRSPLLMPTHSLSQLNAFGQNSNMQLGNQLVNKPSLQLLQQQQPQPQQQPLQPQPHQSPIQRKMMMGLGTVGIGNIPNNMVGLGGLGNVMSIGGARGMAATGISAPVGTIGMGNMGQNPMSLSQASNFGNAISQQLRSGAFTSAQAHAIFATRLKMAQNRGMLGGPQSTVAGVSGVRQMQPGSAGISMLGQTLNRGNISAIQRTAMGAMPAPKLVAGTGMNVHMGHQQLPLPQQQQQQMQQPQQHQLQLQQQQPPLSQQQENSPLQAVVSPSQVSSPSTLGIPQPITQPLGQQQQQASPQLSSGAMHPLSGGNPEAAPASPQLSSQTLGSVGSITNSPMDLQGVNKSNSMSNT